MDISIGRTRRSSDLIGKVGFRKYGTVKPPIIIAGREQHKAGGMERGERSWHRTTRHDSFSSDIS